GHRSHDTSTLVPGPEQDRPRSASVVPGEADHPGAAVGSDGGADGPDLDLISGVALRDQLEELLDVVGGARAECELFDVGLGEDAVTHPHECLATGADL